MLISISHPPYTSPTSALILFRTCGLAYWTRKSLLFSIRTCWITTLGGCFGIEWLPIGSTLSFGETTCLWIGCRLGSSVGVATSNGLIWYGGNSPGNVSKICILNPDMKGGSSYGIHRRDQQKGSWFCYEALVAIKYIKWLQPHPFASLTSILSPAIETI